VVRVSPFAGNAHRYIAYINIKLWLKIYCFKSKENEKQLYTAILIEKSKRENNAI